MRQIILDTETTGLEPSQGHRIIEIGCVEMVNRRLTGNTYHQYIQPEREVPDEAIEIHGITNEFLVGKPVFAAIAQDFLDYIKGAELIIHNASFDVNFLNHELKWLDASLGAVTDHCSSVIDTLQMARKMHPGQKNNLDALCKRYDIDNSKREFHGALLDSEILADVYLAMTGGQGSLSLSGSDAANAGQQQVSDIRRLDSTRAPLKVVRASEAELSAHQERLTAIDKSSGGSCVWLKGQ
jgi:DNA polymerase-3 subunit epsilon